MLNIAIVGVGGQGSVLAAKLLAAVAHLHGFSVHTAETIGMAQRGGSVVSHVRIDDACKTAHAQTDVSAHEGDAAAKSTAVSPTIPPALADVMIAFEPGEALRNRTLLKPGATVVTATTPLVPAGAPAEAYQASQLLDALKNVAPHLLVVDDADVLEALGTTRCLNTVLLATTIATGILPFSLEDLREAVRTTVRARFNDLNQRAITVAQEIYERNTKTSEPD